MEMIEIVVAREILKKSTPAVGSPPVRIESDDKQQNATARNEQPSHGSLTERSGL